MKAWSKTVREQSLLTKNIHAFWKKNRVNSLWGARTPDRSVDF